MPDPHERSIASALKTVEQLGKLTDRLRAGTSPIYAAYRTVIRSLRGNLRDENALIDALQTLEYSVRVASQTFFERAYDIGWKQAERDLKIYGLGDPDPIQIDGIPVAIVAIRGTVKAQSDRALSVARLDMGDEYVLGDESRQGILTPSPVLAEAAFWLTSLSVLSYLGGTSRKMPEARRQAVAQIDDVTTHTCLNVHGQIVGQKEDFHLTGTPRYADEMQGPPFHRGCRTAVAQIMPEFVKDEVTQEMRRDAIEQGKKAKPSAVEGRAHYKVVGKSVQEFRSGRWRTFERYGTIRQAREAAARLNNARRS